MSASGDTVFAGRSALYVYSQELLAIKPQLPNRVMDVRERKMRGLLLEPTGHIRRPQLGKNFQARHVEIPVMEEGGQLGHAFSQESSILTDAVTAHRRRALIDVLAQEL